MFTKKRLFETLPVSLVAFLLISLSGVALVEARGFPFDPAHNPPFDFVFGNHFDSHQQTQEKNNGDLSGFLYVTPVTEAPTEIDGIRVFQHCDDNTLPANCEAAWIIRGKPLNGVAKFLYHNEDHPVWLIDDRNFIPQPGAFSHFHWFGAPQEAGDLAAIGGIFDGYMLELQAIDRFYFRHSGNNILVEPGIDIRTHVNIVGSAPPSP